MVAFPDKPVTYRARKKRRAVVLLAAKGLTSKCGSPPEIRGKIRGMSARPQAPEMPPDWPAPDASKEQEVGPVTCHGGGRAVTLA